jgi:hypothetical protein
MKRIGKTNAKNVKIIAFTILESIFVIIAVVIISFVLAGLYLKNSKLSTPEGRDTPPESSEAAPL